MIQHNFLDDSVLNDPRVRENIRVNDPISLVRKYVDRVDREIVGFLVSCFSYGRQSQFMPKISTLLDQIGDYPYETVLRFEPGCWKFDWKYRFHDGDTVVNILYALNRVLNEHGSIESIFSAYGPKAGIEYMSSFIRGIDYPREIGNLYGIFPSPTGGSACKRMNMYLRWMVRDEWPDCGVWKSMDKRDLYMPVDTHVFRITNKLFLDDKFVRPDWHYVQHVTDKLRTLYPHDPIKFDVMLCNAGVVGLL